MWKHPEVSLCWRHAENRRLGSSHWQLFIPSIRPSIIYHHLSCTLGLGSMQRSQMRWGEWRLTSSTGRHFITNKTLTTSTNNQLTLTAFILFFRRRLLSALLLLKPCAVHWPCLLYNHLYVTGVVSANCDKACYWFRARQRFFFFFFRLQPDRVSLCSAVSERAEGLRAVIITWAAFSQGQITPSLALTVTIFNFCVLCYHDNQGCKIKK